MNTLTPSGFNRRGEPVPSYTGTPMQGAENAPEPAPIINVLRMSQFSGTTASGPKGYTLSAAFLAKYGTPRT